MGLDRDYKDYMVDIVQTVRYELCCGTVPGTVQYRTHVRYGMLWYGTVQYSTGYRSVDGTVRYRTVLYRVPYIMSV